MSLGLVVLEEKLFTLMHTPTPQSDDIMSADIKKVVMIFIPYYVLHPQKNLFEHFEKWETTLNN